MPLDGGVVRVEGLRELRRGLGRIDKELPKELSRDIKRIGEKIAADARSHVPVRSGRARNSIRAVSAGSRAYIVGGKKSVPYYGWLDFGGGIPNKKGRQRRGISKAWRSRPIREEGRFIYPAVRRARPSLERELVQSFERAKRDALRRAR